MAVAHGNAVESHTGATGSISQSSFSWTHTPVGTPKGILVFAVNLDSSSTQNLSIDYGGVALAEVSGGLAVDTAGEVGRCNCFFLGGASAIAGRANDTVTVNRDNTAVEIWCVSVTVTAAANMDTAVHTAGIVLLQGDGTLAQQSVDDGSPGTNSVRYAGGMSGLGTPPGVGASSTSLHTFDTGAQTAAVCRETTAGQGSRSVGFSSGTSDDRAFVHLAVKEVAIPGPVDAVMKPALQAVSRSAVI